MSSVCQQPAGRPQALHGDAHLANCLPGPLWHDFETACRGPREFDLAALALSARVRDDEPSRIALEAYGDHDADLLEEFLPVYAAWIYASFMVALPRRPELAGAGRAPPLASCCLRLSAPDRTAVPRTATSRR